MLGFSLFTPPWCLGAHVLWCQPFLFFAAVPSSSFHCPQSFSLFTVCLLTDLLQPAVSVLQSVLHWWYLVRCHSTSQTEQVTPRSSTPCRIHNKVSYSLSGISKSSQFGTSLLFHMSLTTFPSQHSMHCTIPGNSPILEYTFILPTAYFCSNYTQHTMTFSLLKCFLFLSDLQEIWTFFSKSSWDFLIDLLNECPSLLFPSTEYGSGALIVMRNESFGIIFFLIICKVCSHILVHVKEY